MKNDKPMTREAIVRDLAKDFLLRHRHPTQYPTEPITAPKMGSVRPPPTQAKLMADSQRAAKARVRSLKESSIRGEKKRLAEKKRSNPRFWPWLLLSAIMGIPVLTVHGHGLVHQGHRIGDRFAPGFAFAPFQSLQSLF